MSIHLNKPQANSNIPLETFEQSVIQFHHRLLTAEADLKSYGRAGGITARAFRKRLRKLQEVHSELTSLQRLCYAEASTDSQKDLGLPSFDACTPMEREIIDVHLKERLDQLKLIESTLAEIHEWIQDASTGKSLFFKITMQMSKLRKKTQAIDSHLVRFEHESSRLNETIDTMLKKLRGGLPSSVYRSTIHSMATLFASLDKTISRVARLKAEARARRQEVARMGTWLLQQEDHIKANGQWQPMPSTMDTARASASIREDMHKEFLKSQKKRDLVEQFWHSLISKPTTPQEQGRSK